MRFDYRRGKRAGWGAAAAVVAVLLGASAPALCQAPTPPPSPKPSPDITKVPTLYEVGYTHLDTEWCWMYPQVINEFIGNTLHDNFALFDKYPDYVFNWTGANRYKFMKEYYPAEYTKLKKYVAAGRWVNTGSSLEEGDVDVPSEESIVRQVLYGNEYFNREFNSSSTDFILPDCFGFPASLPSILAHCGLNGFATQKLTWGSAERTMGKNGIPFDLGVWVGPDNQGVFAALNAGDYNAELPGDVTNDPKWLSELQNDGEQTGIYANYNYYGTGDRGGAVRTSDAQHLEESVHGTGPVHIVSGRSDQVFNDLEKVDTSKLLRYKGDLLLSGHSTASITSQAEMKRWNHENEKLADATERASVAADWLGSLPYDKARITDAWWKFLPGQFHDLLAGTALPMAYEYSWNDEVLALNEFAGQLSEAVGGVTNGLNTSGPGVPVVVYNQLSASRQDVVEATVVFPGTAPKSVKVTGPNGQVVPSQVESRSGNSAKVLFLASAPSVGYATYHVAGASDDSTATDLSVSTTGLENTRYKVAINSDGDVSSIYDKAANKELLTSPLRFAFQYDNPVEWPAWNMDYSGQIKAPEGYVDGPAKISVIENGPVRVAVQIDRWARGSHFIQVVQLSSGSAGDRVEFVNHIDWQTSEAVLKAVLPLTVSNPLATYNWELGTIQRGNNVPLKFEVPTHQWFDVTDTTGSYGVSVLTGDRYGSDKPTDNVVRLTLVLTPGVQAGYTHQRNSDWGHHDLSFAIAGHSSDWLAGDTQWQALRFDRPLVAFQAPSHNGTLGSSFSFVKINNPNVSVEALKQAEYSHKIIVRFNELAGKSETGVTAKFAGAVTSAVEVNGQEKTIGSATIKNGVLVFDMDSYRPRAFAITLAAPSTRYNAPLNSPLTLAYNTNVTKSFGSSTGGSFDFSGNALPADMLPESIVSDGVTFKLASANSTNNAIEAKGQTVSFPAVSGGAKIYLLAASSGTDLPEAFKVGGKVETQKIQAWDGKIGQWDDRVWGGTIPVLTYNMTNPLIGLNPGYIKRDTVAWYSDHIRGADGVNQAYKYCYLYRYAFDAPTGTTSITLPNDPHIKILAATVAYDHNADTVPAEPLYDTLKHPVFNTPHIDSFTAADGNSATVQISNPLYFSPEGTLHYTVDGAPATKSSPVYTDPLVITQSATINTAYIYSDGTVGGTYTAKADVTNPTGPSIQSVGAVSPNSVAVTFSEDISKTTASNPANYTLTPADAVTGASVSDDARTVTLTLATPRPAGQKSTLAIANVTSAAENGLPVTGADAIPIPVPNIVFESDDVQTFDKSSTPIVKDAQQLPTSGSAPWTINLFAYFDKTPAELTTLAGFGDDTDTTGTQRYILKYNDGISFWGSDVDVASDTAYDLHKWQMVTATFDGYKLRLYKNGKLLNTTAISLKDASPVVKIGPTGPWDNAGTLNGKIAGVKIWTTALSGPEIQALFSDMPS